MWTTGAWKTFKRRVTSVPLALDFWARPYFVSRYLEELGVDLELGGGASLLLGGLAPLLDALVEVVDGTRDDAQLLLADVDVEARAHGVGLPRARLDRQEETLHGEFIWPKKGNSSGFKERTLLIMTVKQRRRRTTTTTRRRKNEKKNLKKEEKEKKNVKKKMEEKNKNKVEEEQEERRRRRKGRKEEEVEKKEEENEKKKNKKN